MKNGVLWIVTLCLMGFRAFSSEPPSFEALMGEGSLPLAQQDEDQVYQLSLAYEQKIGFLSGAPIGRIPHVLHVSWLGPKEFPRESVANLVSWKTHHPEWQFCFWTDDPSRPMPVPGMTKRLVQEYDFGIVAPLIALSNNWAEKADMMRYTILFNEGGVYADHDVFCQRSIAKFADRFEFVAACDPSQPHPGIATNLIVNNSTILARPKHPLLGATLERIVKGWNGVQERFPGTDRESTLARVGLRMLLPFVEATKEWCQKPDSRDIILPASYFYSLGRFQPDALKSLEEHDFVYVIHKG